MKELEKTKQNKATLGAYEIGANWWARLLHQDATKCCSHPLGLAQDDEGSQSRDYY